MNADTNKIKYILAKPIQVSRNSIRKRMTKSGVGGPMAPYYNMLAAGLSKNDWA